MLMYVWSCMINSTIHEFHSLPHARIVDIDKEVFLQNKEIMSYFMSTAITVSMQTR